MPPAKGKGRINKSTVYRRVHSLGICLNATHVLNYFREIASPERRSASRICRDKLVAIRVPFLLVACERDMNIPDPLGD